MTDKGLHTAENGSPVVLKGRTCYGHLGGTLGGRLFERMLALGWLEREGDKATVYRLTAQGERALLELGVDIFERR